MKYSPEDVDRLKQDLTFQIDSIARDLLGSPVNRNQKRVLKYGSKSGSLQVTIHPSSPFYGEWHDFQTGEGGDALSLIQKVRGLTFPEALEYAQQRYGEGVLWILDLSHKKGCLKRQKPSGRLLSLCRRMLLRWIFRIAFSVLPLKAKSLCRNMSIGIRKDVSWDMSSALSLTMSRKAGQRKLCL